MDTAILSGVVTAEMLQGVFNEFVALIPIVIPVVIGYTGIRKGLGFVFSTIKSA